MIANDVTPNWDNFLEKLINYRNHFYYGRPPEEVYYLEVFEKTYNLDIVQKLNYIDEIVDFLNKWHCRFSKQKANEVLTEFTLNNLNSLSRLKNSAIEDIDFNQYAETINKIYDSIKNSGIHNMSDACASKFLHILIPNLFVMWDKYIKSNKFSIYSEFLKNMQIFTNDIKNKFLDQYHEKDIEDFLQKHLKYPVRKTIAKYIDEYNWYIAFGAARIQFQMK